MKNEKRLSKDAFERISSNFNINDSSTVNFVYGHILDEVFMGASSNQKEQKFVDIRFLLWEFASSNGYDSVFYDDQFNGFAFDSLSCINYHSYVGQDITVEQLGQKIKKETTVNHKYFENRVLCNVWSDTRLDDCSYSTKGVDSTLYQIIDSPPSLMTQLEKLISNGKTTNLIFVFNHFESIIRDWKPSQKRKLNNIFSEFSYKANGGVKFFLILDQPKLNCEHEIFTEIPSLKTFLLVDSNFTSSQSKGDSTVYISTPGKNELHNFLLKIEYEKGSVSLDERQRCLRFMLSMNQPLKKWVAIFNEVYRNNQNENTTYTYTIGDLKKQMIEFAQFNTLRFGSIKNDDRSALQRLKQDYVGIDDIIIRIEGIIKAHKLGKNIPGLVDGFRMHMAFLGNPGTGKTSVARLIGEVFLEENLLSKGHFIEARSDDFISAHVGGTAIKASEKCKESLGGILFIDEAYSISQQKEGGANNFGAEAIAVILQFMENYRNDFCVIMAGYTNEMTNFIKVNPGLTSRIPENNRLEFKDYSVSDLTTIFENNIKKRRIVYDKSVVDFAEFVFRQKLINRYNSGDPRMWGNARIAEELVQELITSAAEIIDKEKNDFVLRVNHFNEEKYRVLLKKYRSSFDNVGDVEKSAYQKIVELGQQKVTDAIDDYLAFIKLTNKRGDDSGDFRPHIVLSGNPGTGKTTLARYFGRMLKEEKILLSGNFIECKREDLVNSDVANRFQNAIGGVLFIDEAYSLSENNDARGREIINQLLTFMENHRREVVVILAGYKDDMRRFLESNPGLKRRVGREIEIDDFVPDKLVEIFHQKIGEYSEPKIVLSEKLKTNVKVVFEYMYKYRDANFGNAGEVEKLKNAMYANWAKRLLSIDPNFSEEVVKKNNIWDTVDLPDEYQQCFTALSESDGVESVKGKIKNLVGCEQFKTYCDFLINQTILNRHKAELGAYQPNAVRLVIASNNTELVNNCVNILAELNVVLGNIKNTPLDQAIKFTSPSDLAAGYVGQTTPKVNEFFKSATGKIIVINGVADLLKNEGNSFYPEVKSAIIANNNTYSERVIILIVDTVDRVNEFLIKSPSFRSIFNQFVTLQADSPEQVISLIGNKLAEKGYSFNGEELSKMLIDSVKFGLDDSQDIKTLIDTIVLKIETRQQERLIKLLAGKTKLTLEKMSELIEQDFRE